MTPSPIPILLYHSVDTVCADAYRRWMVRPEEFRAHLGALADASYSPITISSLAELIRDRKPIPPRTVAITFDDGLSDFVTGAMPVLEQFGFPATLFVVSGLVGRTSAWLSPLGEGQRPMLDWSDLRQVAATGIEVGAHSVDHPELDILSAGAAFEQIRSSKLALEDGLGRAVRTFAYPHGYSSKRTRALVRRAAFEAACRVRHALSSPDEDPFALSRIVVTSEVGPRTLLDLMEGLRLPIAPPSDRLIGTGWRVVRRLRGNLQRAKQTGFS